MILPDTIISDDNDHHFFYQCFETNYYVTCKLYPSSLIISILNKELYGINIDLNNLKDFIGNKSSISLTQKLYLENNLRNILPLHLSKHPIPDDELRLNSDGNVNQIFDEYEDVSEDDDPLSPQQQIDFDFDHIQQYYNRMMTQDVNLNCNDD
ncbi:17881_t:CDS:1, partial [Funneliformis caledonium]